MRRFRFAMSALTLLAAVIFLALAPHQEEVPTAEIARNYNQEVFVSSVAIYGSLRIVNAALSTTQDLDITAGLVVAEGTISPGKVLEPVDDTIERMAHIVFALAIVSGLLAALMPTAGYLGFLLLGGGLLLVSANAFAAEIGRKPPGMSARASRALIVVGIMLGVGIPGVYCLSGIIGQDLTARAWAEVDAVLSEATAGAEETFAIVEDLEVPPAPAPDGQADDAPESNALDRTLDWLDDTAASAVESVTGLVDGIGEAAISLQRFSGQVARNVELYLTRADELFLAFVNIAIAYVLKLIVLPVILLVSFYMIVRRTLALE